MALNTTSLEHLPALDGLRGLAVLAVMADHLYPYGYLEATAPALMPLAQSTIGMGWLGVDLFFVLSGFLITRILLASRGNPHYFRNFYARRVLRIFPLYYGLLLLFLVVIPTTGAFESYGNFYLSSGPAWPYWAYLSNFQPFIPIAAHEFLAVVWSLAIEEQYYLVYPALVFLVPNEKLWKGLVAAVVISLVLRIIFAGINQPAWAYHITFFRLDAIGIGSLLGLAALDGGLRTKITPWIRNGAPVAALGLAMLVVWTVATWTPEQKTLSYAPGLVTFGIFFGAVAFAGLLLKTLEPDSAVAHSSPCR